MLKVGLAICPEVLTTNCEAICNQVFTGGLCASPPSCLVFYLLGQLERIYMTAPSWMECEQSDAASSSSLGFTGGWQTSLKVH